MILKKTLLSASIVIALAACGGSSSDPEVTPPPPPPANSAPTELAVDANTVVENMAGVAVGELSATDADSGDTFTFTTSDDRFVISGTTLSLAEGVSLDFEENATVTVNVTVTDNGGLTYSKDLTIDVTDIQDTEYAFTSKFQDGVSSVSYSGQIARHVLINELNFYIGSSSESGYGLQFDLDNNVFATKEDVIAKLNYFYKTTEVDWDGFPIRSYADSKQTLMTEISSGYKSVFDKIAGQDDGGQEKDWNADPSPFAGWGATGETTPEGLVEMFFDQLADNAIAYRDGNLRADIQGNPITKVYINTDGTDLKQLIQKFLLMAVTYSQSAGDYLGEDTEGKGLTTDNTAGDKDGTKAYSKLEHQFDEGFGYFGAAVNYLAYNDNEISGKVYSDTDGRADWNGKHDTDGDGKYDLLSEINFGQSVNAGKRDRATAGNTNPTDLTKQTMAAFIEGRRIINTAAPNALTEDQMAALIAQRDIAMDGWEKAIAATVVHYINDTNADLELLKTNDASFSYSDLAKHFSEMKGFALGLQFSPYSKVSEADFKMMHDYMGKAPVTTDADAITAYQADLIKARDILQAALSFDAENVENW
jgi:hypothetical protein